MVQSWGCQPLSCPQSLSSSILTDLTGPDPSLQNLWVRGPATKPSRKNQGAGGGTCHCLSAVGFLSPHITCYLLSG